MHDLMIAMGFVGMVLAPCVVAMFTLPQLDSSKDWSL
ncbi:hypothetical protein SAMN05421770_101526 [Granulicella rosea]|uniref:Uncharacterized protein n=1 Tax=Granulicella rosea TaxID=474952 RepID=A0A239DMX3_9BACT|nr:hypothetical protein SAMN05421770_101526 [Granulicella rosea]